MVRELRLEIRHQLLQSPGGAVGVGGQFTPRLVQEIGPVLEGVRMNGVAAQAPRTSDGRSEICLNAAVNVHRSAIPANPGRAYCSSLGGHYGALQGGAPQKGSAET